MRNLWAIVGVLALSAGILVGCGRPPTVIPSGGHEVHVSVVGSEVRLDPPTVRAGDVFLVLDTPGSGVGFAERKRTPEETPGPLTDDDVDRLRHGDTEGTAIGGFDHPDCSAEERAGDRGRMGYCETIFRVVLNAGTYAFFTGSLEGWTPGEEIRPIAVLQVLP